MKWIKRGLVKIPPNMSSWASTHAMVPFPFQLNKDIIRVFTTFLDERGIGRPGYLDISVDDPFKVLNYSLKPILDIGVSGSFDDNGIVLCSVIKNSNGSLYMYYAGFELCNKIRYRILTGLAISNNGGETFYRFSKVPILERSHKELFIRGGPFVIKDINKFKLWYVAGSKWINLNGSKSPSYDIRYLESEDGISWHNVGEIVLPLTKNDEYAFGRPTIYVNKDKTYRMFYSIRKKSVGSYRLGYAESNNGKEWIRLDEKLNLDTTPNSFDSDAIMYGCPFKIKDKIYLFYNGNSFGKDGFALATLEEE